MLHYLPLEYNCKFVVSFDNDPFYFKTEEDIESEYKKRGFKKVKVANAMDKKGNILMDTFCVFCYADKKEYKIITKDGYLLK